MNKKYLIIGTAVLVLAIGGAFLAWHYGHSESATKSGTVITLTPLGFQPTDITIKKGDRVIFRSIEGKPFWPASDLHPSHLLYPEFDPKQPIAPDATWSFVFEKVGTWPYHDHLEPYFTGKIHVTAQ